MEKWRFSKLDVDFQIYWITCIPSVENVIYFVVSRIEDLKKRKYFIIFMTVYALTLAFDFSVHLWWELSIYFLHVPWNIQNINIFNELKFLSIQFWRMHPYLNSKYIGHSLIGAFHIKLCMLFYGKSYSDFTFMQSVTFFLHYATRI